MDQPEILQSMGQPKVLQVAVEESVAQTTPPCCTSVRMERDLVLVPVPQDLVQAPYLDQPEILQSMGHSKMLQVVVDLEVGQAIPPFLVAVRTERDLVLRPETPQDLVQELYLDQPETL